MGGSVPKILVATASYDGHVHPDTFRSVMRLDGCGCWLDFEVVTGYTVADARIKMACLAKERDADYLFMVDSDVVLPEDALACLMEHGAHVCLGHYAHRGGPRGTTCLCKTGHKDFRLMYTASELSWLAANGMPLVMVKGGGLGCALVKMETFDLISEPWFKWHCYDDGRTLSEDLYFAIKCEKAGIPICADARVACGHALGFVLAPDGTIVDCDLEPVEGWSE